MQKAASALTRRSLLMGVVATSVVAATGLATPALAKGAGLYRSLSLVNPRTGDWVNTVYWADGAYIPDAIEPVNYLMRDWRQDEVKPIAHATLDIMAALHQSLRCDDPFEILSGYRSPKTNALLRNRSRGVARNSYHIMAMAVDLRIQSRSVSQVARAALALNAGGVGRYSRSDFVHVDSGPVRDWGR
jgi:uncharacterized protein YcbK (DUF882 family)